MLRGLADFADRVWGARQRTSAVRALGGSGLQGRLFLFLADSQTPLRKLPPAGYLLVLLSDCTRGRWAAGRHATVCAEGGERGPLL